MPAPSSADSGYANLHYKDASSTSDKVYNLKLEARGSDWVVLAEYGKTAGPLNKQEKAKGTYAVALAEFTKVYREKTGKGYKVLDEKLPAKTAPAVAPGKAPEAVSYTHL